MIEGNFVLTPAAIIAVAWLVVVIRRGLGPWSAAFGLLAIGHVAWAAAVTLFPLPVQAEVIEEHRAIQLASNNLVPLVSLINAVATGGYPAVIASHSATSSCSCRLAFTRRCWYGDYSRST